MNSSGCTCLCVCPPSPGLEKKIINTRKSLTKGAGYRSLKKADLLDAEVFAKIALRPRRTRAHDFHLAAAQASVIGEKRALVILLDFSDSQGTKSQAHFNDMLFSSNAGSPKSMRDYYKEVSYGQLDVTGTVAGQGNGWFRAPKPKSFYTDGNFGFNDHPKNAQKCVEDAITLASNAGVDFSPFDNSGDNFVEALIVICAGSGGEVTGNTGDFWSHKWNITPMTVNGVTINRYFMAPEDGNIGVMAHELGHLLCGLPDLYDTGGDSRGTGNWDLMAGGSWNNGGRTPAHPTAWCKVRCGWVTPTTIHDTAQNITIRPYQDNQDIFKLPIGDADSKEYFLLSNRRKSGFDKHIPGEGMIIEHIDDTRSNNTNQDRYLVDIEQADGQRALNLNANSGDASDAFPNGNKKEFNDASTPNSRDYNNTNSQVSVTNIKKSGADITASVSVGNIVAAGGWVNNKKIISTFASPNTMNAWANIESLGWKKVFPGSTDGVTNIFSILNSALANEKKASVYIDGDQIKRALSS